MAAPLTPAILMPPMIRNTAIHASAKTVISAGRSRDFPLTPAVARMRTPTVATKLAITNTTTNGPTAEVGPW